MEFLSQLRMRDGEVIMMDKKLNILGVEYIVQIVDVVNKGDARRGEINYLTNIIKIDREMPLSQKKSYINA